MNERQRTVGGILKEGHPALFSRAGSLGTMYKLPYRGPWPPEGFAAFLVTIGRLSCTKQTALCSVTVIALECP